VEALDLGADDYITKPSVAGADAPYGPRCGGSRRRSAPRTRRLRLGRFAGAGAAHCDQAWPAVHVTRKEFDILHCLMSRAGRVVDVFEVAHRRVGARTAGRGEISAHVCPAVLRRD